MVKVIWNDAYTKLDFDGDIKDLPKESHITNHSLGYLVSSSHRDIKLVFEISPDEGAARYAYVIPRKYIKEIIYLIEKPEETQQISPKSAIEAPNA